MDEFSLTSKIGQRILINAPAMSTSTLLDAKVLGVEAGGIWIECQLLTNVFLKAVSAPAAPRTPVFFVPYAQILWAFSAADYPSLNEKSFGV